MCRAAFGPVIAHDRGTPLHSLAVAGDGTRIAAGSEHGDIFTWDLADNANARIWHAGSRVLCLAWHPEQERLASGNESGDIHVWQRTAREPVWSVKPGEP